MRSKKYFNILLAFLPFLLFACGEGEKEYSLHGGETIKAKALKGKPRDNLSPTGAFSLDSALQTLTDGDPASRTQAAFGLGRQTAMAQSAFPALITALHDPEAGVRCGAIFALSRMPSKKEIFIASLIEVILNDSEAIVRRAAVESLITLDTETEAVKSVLIAALKDENYIVRCAAARGLEKLGMVDNAVVSALTEALSDEDEDVRQAAVSSLGMTGLRGKTALPKLIVLIKNDKDALVRRKAIKILGKTGCRDETGIRTLIEISEKDDDHIARYYSLKSLDRLIDDPDLLIPGFLKSLQDKDGLVRVAAIESLAGIGAPAVPELVKLMNGKDKMRRFNSIVAVGMMGPDGEDALPALLETLKKKDAQYLKCDMIETIGRMKHKGKPAVIPLLKLLNDPRKEVRLGSAWALGEIKDDRAVKPLIAALEDADEKVRETAIKSLGKTANLEAVPSLITSLASSFKECRFRAAIALGKIKDIRATDSLIRSLSDPCERVRSASAWALGKIGDKRAIGPLKNALKDSDDQVRKKAAQSLGILRNPRVFAPLMSL